MESQKREIMIAVGQRIKYFRHMQAISQESLALCANINPAYFGQVERGLKCPTVDTLYKIANALDIPASELLRTDAFPNYTKDCRQRIKDLLSQIPDNKVDQVLKIVEDIVDLL